MKNLRKIMAAALVVIMSLSLAIPAFAAETVEKPATPSMTAAEAEIMPLASTTTAVRTNGAWTQVASNNSGFGCNVTVSILALDTLNYKVDVGLFENLVTTTPTTTLSDIFGYNSSSKTFYVASNIKYIQVRITPRATLNPASALNVTVRY